MKLALLLLPLLLTLNSHSICATDVTDHANQNDSETSRMLQLVQNKTYKAWRGYRKDNSFVIPFNFTGYFNNIWDRYILGDNTIDDVSMEVVRSVFKSIEERVQFVRFLEWNNTPGALNTEWLSAAESNTRDGYWSGDSGIQYIKTGFLNVGQFSIRTQNLANYPDAFIDASVGTTCSMNSIGGSPCWIHIDIDKLKNSNRESSLETLIAHAALHSLGIRHEHTRADRDDYITVNTTNIQNQYDYTKISAQTYPSYGTKYDYYSLLHASPSEGVINPSVPAYTILQRDARESGIVGNATFLSPGDVLKIRLLYQDVNSILFVDDVCARGIPCEENMYMCHSDSECTGENIICYSDNVCRNESYSTIAPTYSPTEAGPPTLKPTTANPTQAPSRQPTNFPTQAPVNPTTYPTTPKPTIEVSTIVETESPNVSGVQNNSFIDELITNYGTGAVVGGFVALIIVFSILLYSIYRVTCAGNASGDVFQSNYYYN